MKVLKFGGSSVGNAENIEQVAAIVAENATKGRWPSCFRRCRARPTRSSPPDEPQSRAAMNTEIFWARSRITT